MSAPISAAVKKRDLVTTQTISSAVSKPDFPTAPDSSNRVQFAGDFSGARILGFEFENGALTGVTTFGCTIEHSDTGASGTWTTLKALTGATAAGLTRTMLTDSDVQACKYLRATFAATAGAFGSVVTVIIRVLYIQVGAPGKLRPPGYVDRLN